MQGDTLQQYARNRVEELTGAGLECRWEVCKISGKVFMLITGDQ